VNLAVELEGDVYLRTELRGVHVNANPDGEELHVMSAHQATGAWNANVSQHCVGKWKELMIACTGECTQCDDGLIGTGSCLGTTTDSIKGELL
jgi:hypothetical protein